ncbi:MAG: hypothetical protein AAGM22_06850 [Acidobacteriota bacterium]
MKLAAAWALLVIAVALPGLAAPPPDLIVLLDGSQNLQDPVGDETELQVAVDAVRDLAAGLDADQPLGLVGYGHRGGCQNVETLRPAASMEELAEEVDAGTDDEVWAKVTERLGARPGADAPATRALEATLSRLKLDTRAATVVLVAGGGDSCGGDPCSVVGTAHSAGVTFRLHIIGFGLGERSAQALECAAEAGGGEFTRAEGAAELVDALAAAAAAPPDVPTSGLRLGATADGELADVTVHVTDPTGGQRGIARTHADAATNPRFLPLPPGRYRATVSALAIEGARREHFEFVVEADEVVERTVDFSAAALSIGVTHNGVRGDAVVRIKNDAGKQVAAGRLNASSPLHPKLFRLHPGAYAVEISSSQIAGEPSKAKRFELEVGEPAEWIPNFQSGTLAVTVHRGDKLAEALITVRRAGEPADVTKKRTRAHARSNPIRIRLEPGDYDVEVREIGGERRVHRAPVTVQVRQSLSLPVRFPESPQQ